MHFLANQARLMMAMRGHQAFQADKLFLFVAINLQFFTMGLTQVLQLRLVTLHHFHQLQIDRKVACVIGKAYFFALKAYDAVTDMPAGYAGLAESVPACDENSWQATFSLLVAVVAAASGATYLIHVI